MSTSAVISDKMSRNQPPELVQDPEPDEKAVIISPSMELVKDCMEYWAPPSQIDDAPSEIHLITTKEFIRSLKRVTLTRMQVADLVESGRLHIHKSSVDRHSNVLIQGGQFCQVTQTDEERVSFAGSIDDPRESINQLLAGAHELESFPKTSISTVLDVLRSDFSSKMADDFQTALASLARSEYSLALDFVLLLVGSKNEVTQYELGRAVAYHDVMSRASISRAKRTLEDQGLLRTTKVHQDIGRPRSRLRLPERLERMEIEGLVEDFAAAVDD